MRPIRWLLAHVSGHFWTRCERCGKGFAGFEWKHEAMVRWVTAREGYAAYCPRCARSRGEWDVRWRLRRDA